MAGTDSEYSYLETLISSGTYDLAMLGTAADRFWALGKLTDAQHEDILAKAVAAAPSNLPDDDTRIANLETALASLKETVATIQETLSSLTELVGKTDDVKSALETLKEQASEDTDEWPDFVQPTGAHNVYKLGDKVTYNAQHYISLLAANSWSPDEYPQGWKLVTEDE